MLACWIGVLLTSSFVRSFVRSLREQKKEEPPVVPPYVLAIFVFVIVGSGTYIDSGCDACCSCCSCSCCYCCCCCMCGGESSLLEQRLVLSSLACSRIHARVDGRVHSVRLLIAPSFLVPACVPLFRAASLLHQTIVDAMTD